MLWPLTGSAFGHDEPKVIRHLKCPQSGLHMVTNITDSSTDEVKYVKYLGHEAPQLYSSHNQATLHEQKASV